jgi:hypothetical protein
MIPNIKSSEGIGDGVLKKVIHAGSESIMFSVLQETQYVYPFKSSVREIVSNCLDSVTERNNSRKIIQGDLLASDLYITKEGSEFSGSGFNSEYYDLKWLSDDDTVQIVYVDNDTATRDRIKFIDNGVGLGGERLINYFSLGYSTKRLSKNQLGSFGLGAKSLLATGVDFYTVTSRYNGREYSFHVYKDHVVSAIAKFEDDLSINEVEVFFEGLDNEYSVYYRNTEKLNGVIIETEVKRHRKMDFISSIDNQLGFIPNIELLISDANAEFFPPTKRNIAVNVLFSNDKLLVGESDYYAVPQILLKPGDDSNIMISYGTINFEELEMKKYTGNVSFILNINDVDVTPSRENVIWNTKTREAVKNMFISAQKTVTDLIEDKIKNETNLPDYLTLLANFKDKNTISGINELYKIVDVSAIETNYRGFKIGVAALQMSELDVRKDFIFTTTENTNQYGSRRVLDMNYNSNLSKDYVSKLSPKNAGSNVVIYIGEPKLQGVARYIADKFHIDDKLIDIIYIKEDLFEEHAAIILEKGIDVYLDELYEAEEYRAILIAEVVRYATGSETGKRVLYHEDIDLAKMSNLAKVQEEAKNSRHLSWAEQQKASGKAIGNFHHTPLGTSRNYYDETSVAEEELIIYQTGNAFCDRLFKDAQNRLPEKVKIVGFSQENFKRFYKIPGVRSLTDCLFTIEFGDLKFTPLGKSFISEPLRNEMNKLYTKEKHATRLLGTSFEFLDMKFKDFKVDNSIFERVIRDKESNIRGKRSRYLNEAKECACKSL